jgi:large subunit ribosomal protein L10
MPTAKKEATIDELRKRLAASQNLFFTSYAGLTVGQISKLRKELRKDGTTYAVVKNTLFTRAAEGALAEALESILVGPTAVAFAGADPVAPAKALKNFADDVKVLGIKAAYIDGKMVDASQVAALASLPTKQQLQASVLGLLSSPMRGLVGVLAANPAGFVRVLSAREKQLAESPASTSQES